MPVPWAQIVRLMPTIIEVSSELLKRTRRSPSKELVPVEGDAAASTLENRLALLEDNERRAAELDAQMADQLAQLTQAATALHAQNRRLVWAVFAIGLVAVIALIVALLK